MRKLITLALILALATVSFGQGKIGFENNTIIIGTTVFSEKAFSNLNDICTKSTGLIKGGVISINGGDNTLIDISVGCGQIVDSNTDPDNPVLTPVVWSAKTGYNLTTMPDSGDVVAIFLALDSGGNIVERLLSPTPEERRNTIDLGIVARIDNGMIVFAGSGSANVVHNPGAQLQDLMEAWGTFNVEGNRIQPYGAGLQFKKTEGSVFHSGANFQTNGKNPHVVLLSERAPVDPFNYKLSDGTDITLSASQIDPNNYDDGTSVLATVPNNEWTVQLATVFASGVFEVFYGQEIFDNEEDAIIAIPNIDFIIPADSKKAIRLGYIVLQEGDVSLAADRFYRITRGGAGGGSVSYWNRTATELSPSNAGDDVIIAIQTELASYPNFSADPGWTIFSGSNTWTYDGDNDRMRPTGELTGDVIANTGISLTSGITYVITVSWAKSAGSLQIYQGSAGTLKSDYMNDDTLSRRWVFTATASENVFVRTTSGFHDDETTDYISEFSVIEIDNAGDIVSDRLALGGAKPEYYSQLDSYGDAVIFLPSDKGILTVSDFAIRNVNSGGVDFDETYARIILSTYGISAAFGSNGYTTTSLRADSSINLRIYTDGGAITVNEGSWDTDYILNGSDGEVYKYDAGNTTHAFTGNVGIGINSPSSILHIRANTPGTVGSHPAGQLIIQDPDDNVYGNVAITGYESDGAGNPDQQLWYLGSSSGSNTDIIFLNRRNADLTLGTNNVSRMTIDGGGDVGIGTTTPQGALDVSSTTGAFIVPRMTTAQRDALTEVNGMIIYNTSTNQFNFYENGAWVTK